MGLSAREQFMVDFANRLLRSPGWPTETDYSRGRLDGWRAGVKVMRDELLAEVARDDGLMDETAASWHEKLDRAGAA
jgi:hypothetical protein